jgi:hypothetical protein
MVEAEEVVKGLEEDLVNRSCHTLVDITFEAKKG